MFRKIYFGLFALAFTCSLQAQVRITEWMYNGMVTIGGVDISSEFVEFTNLGSLDVDFSGWSFDDDSRVAGSFDLSAFGTVAPGESVILSEATAADFRSLWNLPLSVKIIGENSQNLGRPDEINLYDSSQVLVDRLTFGDQTVGGPRTNGISGWTTVGNLGLNNVAAWQLSVLGDAQNSYASAAGTSGALVGNPGTYAVPEPGTVALFGAGFGALLFLLRRRRAA